MASSKLKTHQTAILVAALISVIAWGLPGVQMLLLPLSYLNTHLHELSHALAAIATGGAPMRILVFADGSGVTPVIGGNTVLLASAGYVGAALMGAAIIYFSRTEPGARTTLRLLAIILAVGMLLFVRGDVVGLISGYAWVALLFAGQRYIKGPGVIYGAQFLGVQQCLNAFRSIYDLVQISARTERTSDAMILQGATHIPAIVWALGWTAFSAVVVFVTLRSAWSRPPQLKQPVAKS